MGGKMKTKNNGGKEYNIQQCGAERSECRASLADKLL